MALDTTLLYGPPKIKTCTAYQVASSSYTWTNPVILQLPSVDAEGGVIVNDVWARAIRTDLLTGGVRFIPGGVRHNITLTWSLYDPTYSGLTIGTAEGNTPTLVALHDLIAQKNHGLLFVCPGTRLIGGTATDVYYRVACTSDMVRDAIRFAAYGNTSLTFEGLDVFADSTSQIVVG